jgi:zinc protease
VSSRFLKRGLLLVILILLTSATVSADIPPLNVERNVLSNGLTVLVSENHSLPLVTMYLLLEAGSSFDPAGQEGLAYVTAKGLLLGTKKRTAVQISESLDFLGATLNSSADRDYITVSLRVLSKDLDKAFDLFFDILTGPTFPEDQVQKEIARTIGALRSEENSPGTIASREFGKVLFEGNPYGHPVKGTMEALPRLTRGHVERFHGTNYLPNGAILAIVGDISAKDLRQMIIPKLESWQRGERTPIQFAAGALSEPKTIAIDRSITQANIILGNVGISRQNPDFYSAVVMNYILGGGGFSSRLMEEVRSRRGLAYSVSSAFQAEKHPGPFYVALQTKNASARESIALALKEIERIRKEPVTDKEIDGAKKYLIGSFPLRLDTQAKLAGFLVQVEYYGLGLDYPQKYPSLIKAVTKEDIQRVARTYLHPDNYLLVVVANLKEAGMDATKSGE